MRLALVAVLALFWSARPEAARLQSVAAAPELVSRHQPATVRAWVNGVIAPVALRDAQNRNVPAKSRVISIVFDNNFDNNRNLVAGAEEADRNAFEGRDAEGQMMAAQNGAVGIPSVVGGRRGLIRRVRGA
jgi:hypothetical protein